MYISSVIVHWVAECIASEYDSIINYTPEIIYNERTYKFNALRLIVGLSCLNLYMRSTLPANARVQIKKRVQSKHKLNNQITKLSVSQGRHEYKKQDQFQYDICKIDS